MLEIVIRGKPIEIADLVLELQSRPEKVGMSIEQLAEKLASLQRKFTKNID